jgi:hypothetical protein
MYRVRRVNLYVDVVGIVQLRRGCILFRRINWLLLGPGGKVSGEEIDADLARCYSLPIERSHAPSLAQSCGREK